MPYLNIQPKNTGDTVTSNEFNTIVSAIQDLQKSFGWGTYFDTQFTDAIPQVVVGNNSWQTMLNNAGGKIEDYLPYEVPYLYDAATNKIQASVEGSTGGGYITFFAKTSANEGTAEIGVDINADIGVIFERVLRFPRGAGVYHPFNIPINAYTLDSFVNNGGVPKIKVPNGETVSIYGSTFFVNLLSRPL